jgi:7-cyano-7-deazaguanine synthase
MSNAVVLFSGGLDSTTVLALAMSQGYQPFPLTISYGQRHSVEIEAARRSAGNLGVRNHKIVSLDLTAFGGSALTDDIIVPKDNGVDDSTDIPVTYVPARNTVMLSLALAYAEVMKADHIFVGVNAVDYSGYPDCRPEYISAFETLANLATKRAVEGNRITIHAPLIRMSKREIIETGLGLGVDFGLTHSCYDPVDGYRACGRCDSCLIRKRAFSELGVEDPVLAPS